jgi:metallo-beta-lactamase class B
VDIFLGAHGSFYNLRTKYASLQAGGANPFIDPAGFKTYLEEKEKAFNTELAAQKAKQ